MDNTYLTTVYAFTHGETILSLANSCTCNVAKMVVAPVFPSDLPPDATDSEGIVEILFGDGVRKIARYTSFNGDAIYCRQIFNTVWESSWRKYNGSIV